MKLDLSAAPGLNTFTGYGPGYVLVNARRYESGVLVTGRRILPWPVTGFGALAEAHFERIAELNPEIVLLGTGAALRFPHPSLYRSLAARRIGVEVMDNHAACRTYNILVAEAREVVAALLFD